MCERVSECQNQDFRFAWSIFTSAAIQSRIGKCNFVINFAKINTFRSSSSLAAAIL